MGFVRRKKVVRPDRITVIVNQVAGVFSSHDINKRGRLYAKVNYGKQRHRTSYLPQTTGKLPAWNEEFVFEIEISVDSIEILIMERYYFSDAFRGRLLIHVSALAETDKYYHTVHRLRSKNGKLVKAISGCIGLGMVKWKHTPGMAARGFLRNADSENNKPGTHKVERFRLKQIFGGSEVARYIKLLKQHGFEDRGALENVTNEILEDECRIHNIHHRKLIMAQVYRLKAETNKKVEKQKQEGLHVTMDGKTFYTCLRDLNAAYRDQFLPVRGKTPEMVALERRMNKLRLRTHLHELKSEDQLELLPNSMFSEYTKAEQMDDRFPTIQAHMHKPASIPEIPHQIPCTDSALRLISQLKMSLLRNEKYKAVELVNSCQHLDKIFAHVLLRNEHQLLPLLISRLSEKQINDAFLFASKHTQMENLLSLQSHVSQETMDKAYLIASSIDNDCVRSGIQEMQKHRSKTAKDKSIALYTEICNVGKTFEASKKRITWRIQTPNGDEPEISLTHSLGSGKKVLRVDGNKVHHSRSVAFTEWDYLFNLRCGTTLQVMFKPGPDLNDMYDLIVDGISFRRLPTNAQDANKGKKKQTRESSESSWQCGTCTLINYKPLANICEACESPRSHAASNPTPSSASAMETMPVETLKQPGTVFDPFSTSSVGQVNVHSNGGHAAQTSSCDTDTQIVNTEKETFDPFSLIDESISSAPEPIVQNKPPSLDPFAVLDGLDFNAPAPAQPPMMAPSLIANKMQTAMFPNQVPSPMNCTPMATAGTPNHWQNPQHMPQQANTFYQGPFQTHNPNRSASQNHAMQHDPFAGLT